MRAFAIHCHAIDVESAAFNEPDNPRQRAFGTVEFEMNDLAHDYASIIS
jgi:hypothetical protein